MSVIQLGKERYQALGASTGAISIILWVYGNEGYEVEFFREDVCFRYAVCMVLSNKTLISERLNACTDDDKTLLLCLFDKM